MEWKFMKYICTFLGLFCFCLAVSLGPLGGLLADNNLLVKDSRKSRGGVKKERQQEEKPKPKKSKTQVAIVAQEDTV